MPPAPRLCLRSARLGLLWFVWAGIYNPRSPALGADTRHPSAPAPLRPAAKDMYGISLPGGSSAPGSIQSGISISSQLTKVRDGRCDHKKRVLRDTGAHVGGVRVGPYPASDPAATR